VGTRCHGPLPVAADELWAGPTGSLLAMCGGLLFGRGHTGRLRPLALDPAEWPLVCFSPEGEQALVLEEEGTALLCLATGDAQQRWPAPWIPVGFDPEPVLMDEQEEE